MSRENSLPAAAVGDIGADTEAAIPNGDAAHRLRLRYVAASYSGGTGGGTLTITGLANGVTWTLDVDAAPVVLPMLDLQSAPGTPLVLTLSGVASAVGHVNAYATYE